VKFILFVEGQTEKASAPEFIKRWLDPRLPSPVRILPVDLKGVGNYWGSIRNQVEFYLGREPREEIIAGIGLVDLSGTNFPAHVAHLPAKDKVTWGKNELEKLANHPKFRQYFAVHEAEAWLLAHKEVLPRSVREALPGNCARPESVNSSQPPSKLLGRLYQQHLNRPYKKPVDGKKLFLDCDPNIVAATCPHFSQMLTDLEQLAREALK
jgi:hypothetical protein